MKKANDKHLDEMDELDELKDMANSVAVLPDTDDDAEDEADVPEIVSSPVTGTDPSDTDDMTYISTDDKTGKLRHTFGKELGEKLDHAEQPAGSASNVDSGKEAVFGSIAEGTEVESLMHLGLGDSIDMKREMSRTESVGLGADARIKPLQYVSMKNGSPVILIVKDTDGSTVRTAKPTADESGYAVNNADGGKWPEFVFSEDDLDPMDGLSDDDIRKIMEFNDMSADDGEGILNGTVDSSPMIAAQQGKDTNTLERVADFFGDVFGAPYEDVCCGDAPLDGSDASVPMPDVVCSDEPMANPFQVKRGW